MDDVDFLGALTWHLDCMALSLEEVLGYRPPADGFHMRMHYSLYITNFMSTVDFVAEKYGSGFIASLEESLATTNFSGAHVLGYLRELRNGVVHRGLDPCSRASVVNGVVCAVAPSEITNRSGRQNYSAPVDLLLELFLRCETSVKPVIQKYIEPSMLAVTSKDPNDALTSMVEIINADQFIPDWVKEISCKTLTVDMMVESSVHQTEKLRKLLVPRLGQSDVRA
ncbi:hypothetical protein AGR7C_Lc120052 [Agrobacterium deltaense Zutra 3/1]|uniref:Uncharacterized protein n=1 Tax=Agrobacterium deltaense Zutra 3/1 TaxID=1183427 RepID=A0A1S7R3Q3_9HYPH|nr:hypothetical protein [Agrobacterium deltaense]CUX45928.1 hypothetical protein AGR7C_Lc120052 [Agrobacterium deltaense Zutra 3/1]